jgi:hypothetical protein
VNEISIVEAWSLWLSGRLSPNVMILGVSIFWWGRLGKVMQFVGAATIIADIIGPERIRHFGSSLHGAITARVLLRFLKDCFDWYQIVFRYTLMKDYTDEVISAKKQPKQVKLDILNYCICFLLTTFVILLAGLPPTSWVFLVEAAIIFGCLLVSVSPILTVLIVFSAAISSLVINAVLIQPLAFALEHPSLDRLTKIVSLLLLLAGFHFELLAS